MTKEEFIIKLKKKLDILEKSEIEDIIIEYEGYIEEKMALGMSEKEAVKALGNVDEIAKDLLSAYKIKENYTNNNSINIINRFVDAVMDGIDAFINVFKGKSNKEIARIIVQIILLFFIISLCKIPFSILTEIGYDTFMTFGYRIGNVLFRVWELILDLIYFGLSIIFFFKILKERIIEKNINEYYLEEDKVVKKNKVVKEKNVSKKEKSEKIKSPGIDIIGIFANIFLFFVKFIVALIAICNAFGIVGISCVLVISIYLIIKGITYYGILFLTIALLLFGISIFELLINFIFDKNNNYTKFLITILSSLVIAGAGMGLFATEIAQTTFLNKFPKNLKTETKEQILEMQDNLILANWYLDNNKLIQIDNTLEDEIRVEYIYYSDYIDLETDIEKDFIYISNANYTMYHLYFNSGFTKKTFNSLMNDAKNKTFYDYSKLVKIKVYINEENYQKIKSNESKYYKDFDNCDCDDEFEPIEEF